MNVVTFVIDRRKHIDGRDPYTVLRMRDDHLDVVSRHQTLDLALEAADHYASQARFAGWDARVYPRPDRSR